VVPLAAVDSSSMGGSSIMDLALNEEGSMALLVNGRGEVYSTEFKANGALKWCALRMQCDDFLLT